VAIELNDDQARAALYCVAEVLRHKVISGKPVGQWLRDVHEALSARGQQTLGEDLDSRDLIDTREAAHMLDCHPRTIRRIAAELDGEIVAGRWCFTRSVVAEYAQARKEHDGRSA